MARRYSPLSDRQVTVLKWVSKGCPDGVWPDFTYKTTAYALAARGLTIVDKRRSSWSATLTDAGRHYLEHGGFPPPDEAQEKPSSHKARTGPTRRKEQPPEDLIAELQANNGTLTVTDPSNARRAMYRRAISRAITEHHIPAGKALRHTGRDHGDLVIRLVDQAEDTESRHHLHEVPVPVRLDGLHPAVLEIGKSGQLLDVTPEHRYRALRILQAVADECVRRGYTFSVRPSGRPTFRIGTGQDQYDFALIEEHEKQPVLDSELATAAKYPWQRIPSTVKDVRRGRLRITLEYGHPYKYWADRHRWRLDSRLPSLFAQIEDLTVAAAAHRVKAEERRTRQAIEKEERLQSWRAHVEKARLAYVEDLDRRRLEDQVLAAARALSIRHYAARMLGLLDQQGAPDTAVAVREWAQWALAEAERIDPLTHLEHLVFTVPDDVDPADLDRFMPKGLTARNPPS